MSEILQESKVHPNTGHESPEEKQMGWVTNAMPWLLYAQEKHVYPLYRRLGGHQSCLDGHGKSRPHRD
jgi:hypothetical protein